MKNGLIFVYLITPPSMEASFFVKLEALISINFSVPDTDKNYGKNDFSNFSSTDLTPRTKLLHDGQCCSRKRMKQYLLSGL